MALLGIGELDDEVAPIHALRADGVGFASGGARRETFGAALEQFEQLLRSAVASPPTSAPLPLFYALRQAGRAIAAARQDDDERWAIRGHGMHGPKDSYPSAPGDAVLRVGKGPQGAYRVVSEATGSPFDADQQLKLGDLWASLPQMETAPGLGAGARKPIRPRRSSDRGESWSFESSDFRAEDVYHLEDKYPALAQKDGPVVQVQEDPLTPGGVRGGIFVPLGRGSLAELAETYLSTETVYVRPAIDGKPPPSILMSWWAILYALSHLARYEPATWAALTSPDRSTLTVPIEAALRHGERILPRLVVHALTGEWR